MQITDIWSKLYLHRTKIIVFGLLLAAGVTHAQQYRWARRNNPNYDERKWTYGFLMGVHSSAYQIKYADTMAVKGTPQNPGLDSVHSVIPSWGGGFSLGFIVNYRVNEFLDLRLTPSVAFYEHSLTYNYTNGSRLNLLVETTMVEFPFLLKYKSMRRGNVRMYVVGGVKPGIEASGKRELDKVVRQLQERTVNMSVEAGIGLDLYFPLFKFSPEIRFSRGVMNVLNNDRNPLGLPLKYVNTNTITMFLLFQ